MFMLPFIFAKYYVVMFTGSESEHFFKNRLSICIALEIQLFTGESLGPIYRFKPATIVCLSQASTWISYVICCGRFGVQLFEVRGDLPFC